MAANKPRAVVSGGAGFIGSHLCEALLDRDMRVLALDNFITGSAQNLSSLQGNPDFEFRQADVNHGVFIGGNVRYVLHFASPASPPQYDANPTHTLKVGTIGTMNMLGLARAKSATFLLASTSEVYGDPLIHPQPESYWGNVNPKEVSVLELAKAIIRLAGSSSRIEHRELPVDDPKQRRPDITHAREFLGWQPVVGLEDGLRQTLAYFRSVL